MDLRFTPDRAFRVGNNGDGGLIVAGDEAAPVRLSPIDQGADAGEWIGLIFSNGTLSGSSLTGLVIEAAGSDNGGGAGCITVQDTGNDHLSLSGVVLDRCAQAGLAIVDADAQLAGFADVTISNSTTGLALDANVIGSIAEPVTTTNVTNNRITGPTVRVDATWATQVQPWIVETNLEISGEVGSPATLTMTGGEFRFNDSRAFRIGFSGPAGLIATGAVFGSTDVNSTAGGDWSGLVLTSNTVTSSLTGVTVKQAGQDAGGALAGITLFQTGGALTITNPIFANNDQADIFVDCESQPTITGAGAATIVNEPNCN
jgi:hypothetical protein